MGFWGDRMKNRESYDRLGLKLLLQDLSATKQSLCLGLEVKPGRPYHHSDNAGGKLHITQATLGTGSSTEKSIVQCSVGDKSPIFLCSLLPDKIESCPLDLEFEEEGLVAFSVIGPRSIHLSGFLEIDGQDSIGADDGSDSYGEDIAETETEESTDYDTDEYDDFIDDSDIEMFPPSPVPNSGVVIEEILDDEKPANGNNQSKRLKKKKQSSESEDKEKQIVVKSGAGVPVLESEDEDGFPISAPHKSKPNVQKPEAEAEEKMDQRTAKDAKKRTGDGGNHAKSLKRKVNDIAQDGQLESGVNQPFDSSHPSTEVVPENDVKRKRRKKKKKQQQKEHTEEGKADEAGADNKDDVLPLSSEQVQKLTKEKSLDIEADSVPNGNRSDEKKKKKRKKKSKSQESGGDTNMEQTVTALGDTNGSAMALEEEKTEEKPSQVRTIPNGLVIEEVAMGKPDGKRASPGKKVSVHYIGKLKKNGKIFDSNVGRAPFKFRLGVGEVIKGWDVGVNGMRVGDKRRLTIPPSMGYGSQGAGGKIPPNAWLLFDVELVDVR